MKKIDRLSRRAGGLEDLNEIWGELLELREKLRETNLKRVLLMYDIALEAFVLEAERLLSKKNSNL